MLSKNLIYLGLLLFGAILSVTIWHLSQPLPEIPLPRGLPINDRISMDPDFTYEVSAREWNEKYLVKFNEPPLDVISEFHKTISYRLILFPTFDRPISIRAESVNGDRRLITKILDGDGGFGISELGRLSNSRERTLSEVEWSELERRIDSSSFWYVPRIDRYDLPVVDGALWVFEGATDIYHKTTRVTPKDEMLELMVYMLSLAGLQMEYVDYYRLE